MLEQELRGSISIAHGAGLESLYEAKGAGGACFRGFEKSMQQRFTHFSEQFTIFDLGAIAESGYG